MHRFNRLILASTTVLSLLLMLDCALMPQYTRGEEIAMDALSQLGAPYVLGQAGPEKFDCSGLIRYCFGKLGLDIPHSAEVIGTGSGFRTLMHPLQLMTGDIVCFDTVNDSDPSDHVGIWLGGNRFVHASSEGKEVMVSELKGYYLEHFTMGKRILCPYF